MLHLLQDKFKTAFAVFLFFLTIFSISYFVVEAGHDCCGEECPICHVIEVTEENIELLEITHIFIPTIVTPHFFSKTICRHVLLSLSNPHTLISQKIRLND